MFDLHEALDDATRAELSAYDDFTAALLSRRGVKTKEEALRFLNPSYDEHIHDPLLMKNMPEAAERLARAIRDGEHIAVWSDYDCDGIPGGVILHDFLKKAGANFENYIPHRHEEGYGVNEMGIEKLAQNGTKLMITVDVGITDVDAIAHARALGIEVIVTDHHLPALSDLSREESREVEGPVQFLPDAIVVDVKQDGETYPFRELCGATTAWKLACATLAVASELREKIPIGWEKWLLDMAGLATIADMVPLVGENRVIATFGLKVLRKSPRVGLQKICRIMRVDQSKMNEGDVAFMLAPRVNAASRMGNPRDAFQLFTTHDEDEADALAKKLDAANRGRRASAAAITRAVHAKIEERKERGETLPTIIAVGDPDWKPALLGLVASGIAEEYEQPVFLWGREANQKLKGSCRTYGDVHVVELMGRTENVFSEFGGHAYSAGFTLKDDRVFFLEEELVKAHALLPQANADESARADLAITPEEATVQLLSKLERLAPFGEGNPKPVFLLRDILLTEVAWFGKAQEHLKITIAHPKGSIEAISFYAKRELGKKLDKLEKGANATLLVNLELDQFSFGRRSFSAGGAAQGVPRLRIVSVG